MLNNAKKAERAFLWQGTDKITGGKCKVNWDTVCRHTHLGGLVVLQLEKIAHALRLRCPWLEWKERTKIWVGMGNPYDETNMDLFHASTSISIVNGAKAPF